MACVKESCHTFTTTFEFCELILMWYDHQTHRRDTPGGGFADYAPDTEPKATEFAAFQ